MEERGILRGKVSLTALTYTSEIEDIKVIFFSVQCSIEILSHITAGPFRLDECRLAGLRNKNGMPLYEKKRKRPPLLCLQQVVSGLLFPSSSSSSSSSSLLFLPRALPSSSPSLAPSQQRATVASSSPLPIQCTHPTPLFK